jgi:hypothetical protein
VELGRLLRSCSLSAAQRWYWEREALIALRLWRPASRHRAAIQQQGDAGLDKTSKFFGNRLAHNSAIRTFAIEHSAEHYGQLVVYYRANNLVPPDSRR